MGRPVVWEFNALMLFDELREELGEFGVKVEVNSGSVSLICGERFFKLYYSVEEFNAAGGVLLAVLRGEVSVGKPTGPNPS